MLPDLARRREFPRLFNSSCPRAIAMIRKLKSGQYRLYSVKKDPKTNRRRNLGTFDSLEAAKQHEREVQYFKRHLTWSRITTSVRR